MMDMTEEARDAILLERALRRGDNPRDVLGDATYEEFLTMGYIQNGIDGKKVTTGLTDRGEDFILVNQLMK